MSKVTYLFGAGASYGERSKENVHMILRGLPVINEIPYAIEQLLYELDSNPYSPREDPLVKDFEWLKEKCLQYPTIDTYAKILYVNGSGTNEEYLHLKRVLALFFLLFQDKSRRDLRYDNFIASLIGTNRELPPIDILTWNYDAQLEFAFSEYFPNCGVEDLWRNKLNVCDKTYFHRYFNKSIPFSITKLNGTAFFEQNSPDRYTHVVDMLLGNLTFNQKVDKAHEILRSDYNLNDLNLPQSGISYVWEKGLDEEFFPDIEQRIADTEVFVVIGYSFPYVNRPTDKRLLAAMKGLKKIYIQDPRGKQIADTLSTLCSMTYDNMIIVDANNQFVIPYELKL